MLVEKGLVAPDLRLAVDDPSDCYTAFLPVPPSANRIWRAITVAGRARVIKSKDYRDWLVEAVAIETERAQYLPGPVEVAMRVYGVTRARDLDNFFKPCLDSLRAARVIRTDNMTCVTRLAAEYDPEPLPDGPGVRVQVRSI